MTNVNAFNLDPDLIYLNHAAVAPWPRTTVEAVAAFATENATLGATNYPQWLVKEQALRVLGAELINAPSQADIALLKNTSEGLSLIAHGIDWKPGDRVVSIAQEFPSNRIVWESLRSQGVQLQILDLKNHRNPVQAIIALCDERTRLISVSSVQYASGLRLHLEPIGAYCRERDILFVVDAIQSLGVIPFDVQACQADVVVADGHKWMLGPEGLALFYCRDALRERLQLHQYGWHMVEDAGDFDRIDWQPARSARRFECGSPNMLGIHALHASLSLLLKIGIKNITGRVLELTRKIIDQVDELGFELLTPRDPEARAGIVTFRVPERDNQSLYQGLMTSRVICAHRAGGIRFSPHFHNTPEQIDTAFQRLKALISRSEP
ncbi:MAG: aminotransferase class V-fold PLP-dependent enzyme [Candidatus Thiodiazotropha sp.]